MRRGLSLVELLVALVLLAIGLLGITASTALALRRQAQGTREHEAASRAWRRLEHLRSLGCTPSTGSADDGRIAEHWRARSAGRSRELEATTSTRTTRGTRERTLTTEAPC
ncbi:MAG: hypothetical protein JWO05_3737 [Gemmatimonadetes bacterium]|nr:hypothetical protein [Gemmatimonadota bacterium]